MKTLEYVQLYYTRQVMREHFATITTEPMLSFIKDILARMDVEIAIGSIEEVSNEKA